MLDNSDYGPNLHPIPLSGSDRTCSMHEAMSYASYHECDIDKSEQLCRYLLAKDPRQPDVIHLWGVIAFDQNQMDEAVKRLRRAVNGYENPPAYIS